jgi:transposase-like protein
MEPSGSSSDDEQERNRIILPAATKDHICEQILANNESHFAMCNQYGMEPVTVRQWVLKAKRGLKLHGRDGRPRLVDEETVEVIQSYMLENGGISDEDLKDFIRHQYDKSCKRKYNEVSDDEDSHDNITYKLKRHTLYRLVRNLRAEAEYGEGV